jgi:hypothetical protein
VPTTALLLSHRRHRHAPGESHFVEWDGKPGGLCKTALASAVRAAKLSVEEGNVTPHH